MKDKREKEWFKGIGCRYRAVQGDRQEDQGLRIVLGGRTWIIRPEAD